MPQRKVSKKQKRSIIVDDDEEFEDPSFSQTKASISDVERERLVGDLMRLVLFADLHKHIVTKRDITVKVLKEYSKKRHISNEIIHEAQKRFKEIFGFEWKELPKIIIQKNGSRKKHVVDSSQKSGKFILINSIKDKENLLTWESREEIIGLLMVILSIIHLNNNSIEQETLYALLSSLGLHESNPDEGIIGWMDYIERKFVRQLYLTREKIPDRVDSNGSEVYIYEIGPRSKIEIPIINIVKFIAEVFNEKVSDIQLREIESDNEDEQMEEAE